MVAITSKEILKQQIEQITTRRRKPKGVKLSARTGVEYNAKLQMIVNEIRKDVNEQIMPLVRSLAPQYQQDAALVVTLDDWSDQLIAALRLLLDRWTSPQFRDLAEQIARSFVTSADTVNRDRFEKDLQTFGIDIFSDSPELATYIRTSVYDNTRLITSIPEQYLKNVESIVLTNVRAGGRPAAIQGLLRDQFGVSQNRAKFIARDQTAKVNGDLSRKRQVTAGFEYFQWIDSDDERVRDRHEFLANRVTAYGRGIYRWSNPPLSDKGQPIIPGQDFQCRCTGRPVSQREVDANVKAGRTNPAVKR